MCFLLLFCFTAEGYKIYWKLKPSPRSQQTVSKRHRLPNDRCSMVVTEVVVWATWKSRHHHLLASHSHKILLGLPSAFRKCPPPNKYLNGSAGWGGYVCNFVCWWFQRRNKPQLLFSMYVLFLFWNPMLCLFAGNISNVFTAVFSFYSITPHF